MTLFSSVSIRHILKCFSFTALSLKPDDALIYNLRAEVRGKIGLTEEAVSDYIQALDLQEYSSVIWLHTDHGFCSSLYSSSSRNGSLFVV